MDEEEYFDIYDTPPMRAALGLYTGHRASAGISPLLADDEDGKERALRRLREARKTPHREENNES